MDMANDLQGIRRHAEQKLTDLQWVEKHYPEHYEGMKEFTEEMTRRLMENRRIRLERLHAASNEESKSEK